VQLDAHYEQEGFGYRRGPPGDSERHSIDRFQECDVLGMILVTVVTFPCSPLSLTIFSTKNY
jgi:hypothetical protein